MSEPIEFRIVQNLQADLRAIGVADGYHIPITDVAVKLDPNHAVDTINAPDGARPLVLIEVNPESWIYEPTSQVKLIMPITVHWVSESDPTDDESRMRTYFRGCADVEKAIAVDLSRGGLAVDTRIEKRTFDTAVDGSQVWARIELRIQLHRTYGQPNG